MEKTNKNKVLKNVVIALCIILLISVVMVTFAWFTDKKSYSGNLTFGEIKLNVSGDGVTESTKTLNFNITRNPSNQKLMPGDSVSLNLNVGLTSNSDPAYYLMFLTDTRGVFEDAVYYSDGTTVYSLDGSAKNVGAITNATSHSLVLNGSVSEDYTTQSGSSEVTLSIYAIQQANLTQELAYDKLFEKHYNVEGVQLKSSDDFKTGLGGTTATKTYTSVRFYDSNEYDAVANGYSLDSTLTTSINSNLKNVDKNKNLIQVYKKSNDIAIVSDKKILAPKDCGNMFQYFDAATTIDVTNLDTSRTSSLKLMFNCVYSNAPHTSLTTIVGLENFNTTNAINLSAMFQGCYKLTSLSGLETWDTSNVMYMNHMFNYCQALTNVDVSNFNTSNVTNMTYMFYSCKALTNVNVSNFNTSNVKNMMAMFGNCESLTSLDVSNFDTSNVTTMSGMFHKCTSLTSLDLTNFNTSNVTNMYGMFIGCSALTSLDVTNFNTSNVTTMSGMFNGLGVNSSSSEVTITGLSNFDTSNVTNMASMFGNGENHTGSGKLTNATLAGISGWDVSKVTNFTCMFYGQGTNLTTLDLSGWDTSSAKSFNHMFADCFKLTSMDMTNWNVQNVRTVYNMFNDCAALTTVGDISNWNTQSLYEVGQMFTRCTSLTGKMDLSGWNTTNVRGMAGTFQGCTGLTEIDLSGWSNVNVMGGITSAMLKTWPDYDSSSNIYYAWSDEANACENMFNGCTGLTVIYVGAGWDTSKYNSTAFTGCNISEVTVK